MKKALSRKNLWDKTPAILKSTLGKGLGAIPTEWFLGRSYRNNYEFVKDSQWWPKERARQYQFNKLREIIRIAYEKTQFYRNIYDAAGFHPDKFQLLDDINKLPTINKQTVVENLKEMCTKDVNAKDVDFGSTGGTSGTPLHFYINAGRSSIEYSYLINSWNRVGYKLGMPMAVLRGRLVRPDKNGFYHEYDPILRHHYYSNFHMSNENMYKYLEHIRHIYPCFLHAYPSSAHTFAKFILGTGQQVPENIKGVLLESENVYYDMVCDIEKAFGVRPFSSYGHSEKCVLATQCEYTSNYHVWPTYGYFELLDERGNPVQTPGKQGEIVGTGFINTVVPFIRYRTGDFAAYVGDCCEACGREHIIITDILGRWPQGGLIASDGSIISMTALNVHDDTFDNVKEYQFHQTIPGKAALCIVPLRSLNYDEQQIILANMNKRLQGQVVLDLEIKSELIKTARGKQLRVIQDIHHLSQKKI